MNREDKAKAELLLQIEYDNSGRKVSFEKWLKLKVIKLIKENETLKEELEDKDLLYYNENN